MKKLSEIGLESAKTPEVKFDDYLERKKALGSPTPKKPFGDSDSLVADEPPFLGSNIEDSNKTSPKSKTPAKKSSFASMMEKESPSYKNKDVGDGSTSIFGGSFTSDVKPSAFSSAFSASNKDTTSATSAFSAMLEEEADDATGNDDVPITENASATILKKEGLFH
jgi:hypothetical protein